MRLTVLVSILGLAISVLASVNGYAWFAIGVGLAGLGAVHLTEEQIRAVGNRFREAFRMAGVPITTGARQWADMDPAQLERALECKAKLDWWRIEMLPVKARQCFALLILRDCGMPDFASTAVQAAPVVMNLDKGGL